jgi:UDP-N-acetylmuramoyl-tripeptide--D-alanyl-D-alanine ligase
MQLNKLYEVFKSAKGVSTDTRTVQPGELFFALKGPNFNGNMYAAQALEKGAIAAVVEDAALVGNQFIVVDDVLQSLQALATHHRRQFNIPVIVIGGSNGKTTTKELMHRVLSTTFKAYTTSGNLNNHIGVPLTLLRMPSDTAIAVIEIGANAPGENAFLCNLVEPNFGLITNIGKDHLEGFGSMEGVAAAYSEIYYYLLKNNGVAFVNTAEAHLSRMASRFKKYISYPGKHDDYHCRLVNADFTVLYADHENTEVQTQIPGAYNFGNIATALCVGHYFGVPAQSANEAIATYQPANNRSQIIQTAQNRLILDAYNANPSSMEAALHNFEQMKASGKIVILGDMLEQGAASHYEHEQIGKLLHTLHFEQIWLVGAEMKAAAAVNSACEWFENTAALKSKLEAAPKLQGKTILLKGSRGIALEKLVEVL